MAKKTKKPQVWRSLPEMVEELCCDVTLLREYVGRAFQGREEAFLGEVAGKLRVLVHEGGMNTPLLFKLMEEFGMEVPFEIDKPRGTIQVSLKDYLDGLAFVHRMPGGEYAEVKRKDLIVVWAQQKGASHKDWQLDEEFAVARASEFELGGLPAVAAVLGSIARTVLHVAEKFLSRLTPEMIAQKE